MLYLPDFLDLEGMKAFHPAFFTGFLTLGGLMVASLGIFTTRIHEMMGRESYKREMGSLLELHPETDVMAPLKNAARLARQATLGCFLTAFIELLLGCFYWTHVSMLIVAVLMIGFAAYSASQFIQGYLDWLTHFEQLYREEIAREQRKGSAGRKWG